MKKVLLLAQVIPRWYLDIVIEALGENVHIDAVVGSDIDAYENVSIFKAPIYERRSIRSRFLSWIRFGIYVLKIAGHKRGEKYDLIFAVSNPPVNAFLGLIIKKNYKSKFVYVNWDIYPQIVEKSLKSVFVKFMCQAWHRWNRKNYKKIDMIITPGKVMKESIEEDTGKVSYVKVVPLGADTRRLKCIDKEDNAFIVNNRLDGKFIVLYSGNMGIEHNIKVILRAARRLIKFEEIQFVLIGGGTNFFYVKEYINDNGLSNVNLMPYQTEEIYPMSIACGDVGIISINTDTARFSIPSKVYSMLACGTPIIGICTPHDDLYELISENRVGICVSENDKILAETIQDFYTDRAYLKKLKRNALKTVEEQFSTECMEKNYEKVFLSVMKERK